MAQRVKGLDFSAAGEAAGRVKKTLQQIGVQPSVVRRVAIVTYEVEMNIVIHARRGTLRTAIAPGRVEVVAEDEGPGIADIEQAMEEGFSTAPDQIREMGFGGGMGLPNIRRCSDELSIVSTIGRGVRMRSVISGW
ncbi:MAG: ATP-binding protein [Bacillota bacterium]